MSARDLLIAQGLLRPDARTTSIGAPIAPTPARSATCLNWRAEAERLALAGVHPSTIVDGDLYGEVGRVRGQLAEERVVRVLIEERRRPWWLRAARRGDDWHDAQGADVLVSAADVGELWLQVKSSTTGAHRFRRSGRPRPIGVVVAPPELEDEIVWARAMGALITLRELVAGADQPETPGSA